MRWNKVYLLLIFVFFTGVQFAIQGCASTPARPVSAQQDPIAGDGYPNIVIEKTLKKGVVVDYGRIIFDESSGTTPAAAQVPLRSNTKYAINLQYQFSWFDSRGRFIRNGGWKYVALPSGQERMLTGNAIDAKSAAFRLEIRSAR